MSAYTFEIVRPGEPPIVANVMTLADDRGIWRHVEALALGIKQADRATIRVKNDRGETVVRAGVLTALASVQNCPHALCPLKKGFESLPAGLSSAGIELAPDFAPCENRRDCTCDSPQASGMFERS